jgi:ATP-dependent Clp protease ATP-binding subunit ClpA
LERRFQPVKVEEPSITDTVAVLRGIKGYYEKYPPRHRVRRHLHRVPVLSERYITDRFLPDRPSTCSTRPAPAPR